MECLTRGFAKSPNKIKLLHKCSLAANENAVFHITNVRHLRGGNLPSRRVLQQIRKDYYVEKSSAESSKSELEKPVNEFDEVITQRPTSITVQMIGRETWPYISEWQKEQLVRRSRRVLPLPVSLTGLGDGQMTRFWRHKMVKALNTLNRIEKQSVMFCEKLPLSVRLFLDNFPEKAKILYPKLYEKYINSKSELATYNENSKLEKPFQFPHNFVEIVKEKHSVFSNDKNHSNDLTTPKRFSDGVIDNDYSNFLKHHNLLQYFATGLKGVKSMEYESEIEGWSFELWRRNYGSPDPNCPSSSVPCSGCGAFLHCTDISIPGYMPNEKFKQLNEKQLHVEQCQRCQFLQHFNVSIDVNVHPKEYPKFISKIYQNKNAMVIIMVDLLDFPCSLWPGIINLIGKRKRIYIVGNKVDLLPKDDQRYLEGVKNSLRKSLYVAGVDQDVNPHVSLISAKTGFGVEELITQLMKDWRPNKDIYLIGCTNVGKSTLFNVLLQSDLCKLRENDLINRATTSFWPGTTLNLLKFPIKKLNDYEIERRWRRLRALQLQHAEEKVLRTKLYRQTRNKQYATLYDRVGMTFRSEIPFTVQSGHPLAKKSVNQQPFNPDNKYFKDCNFFYDTPGTIYKDQILTLLTTEELLKTIPRELITPRTFVIRPLQTLFLGGLGRIDLVHARQHVWFTVFASHYLPIHIVYTEEAKRFYAGYLGTDMLGVPMGGVERLKHWPALFPKEIKLESVNWTQSCADIVLSSAGWVSVTMGPDTECVVRAFTPEGRGIYVRNPPLLSHGFRLRGKRIYGTPCFENKLFTIDNMVDGKLPKRYYEHKEYAHRYSSKSEWPVTTAK